MDTSLQEDVSSTKSDESPSRTPTIPGLTSSTNPRTMREYDSEFQELKRENFDLKLRIFFLEQTEHTLDSSDISSSTTQRHRRPLHPSSSEYAGQQQTSIIDQSTNEHNQVRQASLTSRHQQGTQISSIQSTDEHNEIEKLNLKLQQCREENAKLRNLLRDSDNIGDNINQTTAGRNIETLTTVTSFTESTPDTAMPVSRYTYQLNERERKLREENDLLKQETASLQSKLFEVNNKLQQVNETYTEEQAKAERVLKRLTTDYNTRIASMQAENQQKLATYESYRHEQEQTSSDVNVEEHLRKIHQQGQIIKKLENQIKKLTEHPPINPRLTEENFQRLNEKLESYAKIIENLRAECNELGRSEAYLQTRVATLVHILDPTISSADLPPLPRPSSTTVTEAALVQNPEAAVAQVTVQLRNVADDVSGLTNRISKLKRDFDDSQTTVRKQEIQIRQHEVHLSGIEKQMKDKYELQIQTFEQENNNLIIQIDQRDRRLRESANEIDKVRLESRQIIRDLEMQYTKEQQTLQEQNQKFTDRLSVCQQELNTKQETYNELRKNYESLVCIP
ncbi:unnamed protein product [Rotaria sp. Silwood2]|nr:unnamed protein product [Rotaria sp. Silwood2]CAF4108711.1 unnamed protein product [Rotaria sp. Silwood2]